MIRISKFTRTRGIVVRVIDGDTIVIRRWFRNMKIRLAEIDSPEKSQKYGTESTVELKKLLPEGSVVCGN